MIKEYINSKLKDKNSFLYELAEISYDTPSAAVFILVSIVLVVCGLGILLIANPIVFGLLTLFVYSLSRVVKALGEIYKVQNNDRTKNR